MTTITRTSSLAFHQKNLGNITELQSSLYDLTGKISSGKQFDELSELSQQGNLEKLFSFREQIRTADSFIASSTVIQNRVQANEAVIDSMTKIMESFESLLVSYNDIAAPRIDLEKFSEDFLTSIKGQLNTSVEGRYLFSGGRTDQLPVSNIELISNLQDNNTNISANYYQGDNTDLEIKISSSTTITYSIRANDEAFQKIIGAGNLAKLAGQEGNNTYLVRAKEMLDDAYESLTTIRTQNANNLGLIEESIAGQRSNKILLSEFSAEIENTDIVAATAELSYNEAVLQASFITFSRLSNLSLADFL